MQINSAKFQFFYACKQKFVAHLNGIELVNVAVNQIRINDILQIVIGICEIAGSLVEIIF